MAQDEDTRHGSVLVIDDDAALLQYVNDTLSDSYRVFALTSPERMFGLLDSHRVDMILLDVHMPGTDGYAVIRQLKESHATRHIPVIFLTGDRSVEAEVKALTLGALDYVTKPFAPQLLRRRVDMAFSLERQKNWIEHHNIDLTKAIDRYAGDVINLQHAVIAVMGEMLESCHAVPEGHVEKVRRHMELMLGGMVSCGLYLDEIVNWQLDFLVASAVLYDLGKPSVRHHLQKPGDLRRDEWDEVRKHVIHGEQIIERLMKRSGNSDFLTHAMKFAAYHHERWDGRGYPYALKGEHIPLEGRIMAIVDTYNAIVAPRPHRPAQNHEEAVRIITENGGSQFDPHLIRVFEQLHEKFRFRVNEREATIA